VAEVNNRYTVVDEFMVKGNKILVLDKKIDFKDFRASSVMVSDDVFPFGWTHNEFWVTIQSDKQFLGKELVFV